MAIKNDEKKLNAGEYTRFDRQIMLPEIGVGGQKKIKNAKVLIIGVGGLGSPLALYLVAAGVGEIGLIDDDVVDVSNLQRQVIYTTEDVGQPKVESARKRLKQLYPAVEITTFDTRLSDENAFDIISGYDIVVDGSDNFETRYLVNDACVLLGKPNVYASIYHFEGHATIFGLDDGPCYRCLHPEPPPSGLVTSCGENGVIGMLPGVMASIQATEVIKLITGIGDNLAGRLLLFDALAMHFQEFPIDKNPECAICGADPEIKKLQAITYACSITDAEGEKIPEVSVEQLAQMLDAENCLLIDLRSDHERAQSLIEESEHIPFGLVEKQIGVLDRSRNIVFLCRSGLLSRHVVRTFIENDYRSVFSLAGGAVAWAQYTDQVLTGE